MLIQGQKVPLSIVSYQHPWHWNNKENNSRFTNSRCPLKWQYRSKLNSQGPKVNCRIIVTVVQIIDPAVQIKAIKDTR